MISGEIFDPEQAWSNFQDALRKVVQVSKSDIEKTPEWIRIKNATLCKKDRKPVNAYLRKGEQK